MADVKWIKLSTGIFDNRKIRQIECLPDGDSIIVIWVKLLCLAGEINDCGMVYFTREIPYTDQMLAQQFNRPLTTIQMALNTFQQFGMIQLIDNILHISNWEKYQNIEGLEKIREQTRKRVAKCRENKRLLLESNVTCNVTVTDSNATEEDIEEDKEKDIEREKKIDYNGIMDAYNTICPSFPTIRSLSEARKKAIKARLNTYTVEDIHEAFRKAEASDFLKGKNDRNWQANFDWIMKDANMAKILDGNYDNRVQQPTNKTAQQLDEFYDMAARWAEGG